jgi:antitoxin (DNA-binding transcriptional repressor) of toxin-antitoxin stability system
MRPASTPALLGYPRHDLYKQTRGDFLLIHRYYRFLSAGDIWLPDFFLSAKQFHPDFPEQGVDCSLTQFVHTCTLHPMKLSISEARRRLPQLVRQVRKDAGAKVEITVRDEVVAELRGTLPEPEPGAAARKLVQLMRKLPKYRGRKTNISRHVKQHVYGSSAKSR